METNLHYRLTHDEVTNTPICDGYVSVPCSPAIKNTESNDERVKKLLQRMSARHLDLIRELSEKNREKEEQLRREEQRQRKRESSLRSRILARTGSLDVDDKEKMGDLPTLPPDETASAEERRLWKAEGAEEEALDSPRADEEAEAEALPGSPAEEQEVPHEAESAEVTVQPAMSVHLEVPSDEPVVTGVTDDGAIRAAQRQRKQSSYLARRQFVAEEPLSFRRSGYAAQQPNRTTVSYAAQRGREQLASSTGDPASPSAGRLKCNADIEKRQQEAINRLQEFQKARSLKLQREQLKREWRAHRAKSYLLEQCQNSEIKEYLESKEKPKALPRLPSHSASASPARILAARRRDASEEPREEPRSEPEEAGQTAPEDGSPNAEAAPSPSSVQAAEVTEAEVEVEAAESPPISFKGSPSAPSKPRMGPSRSEYISRFVSRMRNAQIAMKCARHLSDWKRLHSCPQSSPVFICAGGYPDFTNAMRRRGWFQNEDKDSRFFDVKWAPAAAIDHDNLLTGQVVNHFHGNREITTKVGLTLNLRNCLPMCGADPDAFYPRAYDLYEPGERSEFAMNFKFTKAQAILREFLRNLDGRAAMTFSSDVVRLAYKICLRLVTDPADVMDSPELAEGLNAVSDKEWAVLEQVCLDDCTQRLESVVKAEDLNDFINKKQVPTEAMREREKKEKARQKEKEKLNGGPVVEEKKKKKPKAKKGEEEPLCAPVSSFRGIKAEHLIKNVREVLDEMDATSRQFAINGCRNAWIVKPSGKSRGRGIKVMRELDEIFRYCASDGFQWVCQKYIERPQLIHGYKFDIRQWATGAIGAFVPASDSTEEEVHIKVEKGAFQEGHNVRISGKDYGVVTSIKWCSDNWTSVRDWQTPLTPEDVTLYDFNYYRLSPSTVPMGILTVGLTASECNSDDACLQEGTRAKGRISSVADEEVGILVDRGRFEVGYPITIAGKVVGSPDALLWNDEGVLDFVACLEQHATVHSLGLDAPYWVCAYANDQHELGSALGTDPKASSFFRALMGEECRGVLLILNRPRPDNIPAGVPFTRIWCVFEQFVALTSEYSPKLSLDICSWDGQAAQLLVQGLTDAET
eukprot:s386_g5.t3